jgi:hypothetical protein
MRKIHEATDQKSGCKAKVYWNSEYREFVVRFYSHRGEHLDASDYYTDDREDAIGTATVQLETLVC